MDIVNASRPEVLKEYRRRIDSLDDELVALLGRRFALIREVAELKKAGGIPAFLPDRVSEVIERCAAEAGRHAMDPSFVASLYGAIVGESCRLEALLIGQGPVD